MKRNIVGTCASIAVLALSLPCPANALDEIIVTGSYRNEKDLPGSYLKRRGDHLLLAVTVVNDTREEAARKNEIYETLKNAVDASSKQSGMELSVFDAQGNLIALTRDNYQIQLSKGSRPDTSTTSIRIKMKIPENVSDADQMTTDMLKFVRQIKAAGRTTLEPASSVEITIVDPNQYRAQIIQRFADDVAQVMKALGADYRLLVQGIDKPVKFSRVGSIEVALYIPYSYHIVPTSVNSIAN